MIKLTWVYIITTNTRSTKLTQRIQNGFKGNTVISKSDKFTHTILSTSNKYWTPFPTIHLFQNIFSDLKKQNKTLVSMLQVVSPNLYSAHEQHLQSLQFSKQSTTRIYPPIYCFQPKTAQLLHTSLERMHSLIQR